MNEELRSFIRYAYAIKDRMPNMRVGPSLMGKLKEIDTKLYDIIAMSEIDPYFSDENIPKFLEYINSKISNYEATYEVGNCIS